MSSVNPAILPPNTYAAIWGPPLIAVFLASMQVLNHLLSNVPLTNHVTYIVLQLIRNNCVPNVLLLLALWAQGSSVLAHPRRCYIVRNLLFSLIQCLRQVSSSTLDTVAMALMMAYVYFYLVSSWGMPEKLLPDIQ